MRRDGVCINSSDQVGGRVIFKRKKKVSVDWTRQKDVHALVQALCSVPEGRLSSCMSIRAIVDGQMISVDFRSSDLNLNQIAITMHSHLLTNGVHRIGFILSNPEQELNSDVCEIEVRNEGDLAEQVRRSLLSNKVPLFFTGPCDSGRYDYSDSNLSPWFDRPDAHSHIERLIADRLIERDDAESMRSFVDNGYLILPESIDEKILQQANADMDRAIAEKYQGYIYGESTRLTQMHLSFPGCRSIWLHSAVHRMLGLLFGEPSQPCQSLVYVFGSQQDAHQDTIHLTPFPAGYMCGVWVALEDVQDGSGELVVYPGSHRFPRVYLKDVDCPKVANDWTQFGATVVRRWEELVRQSGIDRYVYKAKSGDVLIWHENLMHAGSVRQNKSKSRRSIVTHHFARGSLVYYDSTGIVGWTQPMDRITN